MVGRTLNHYTVVEPLGKGGMGEVWVAEDKKLGRRVALKVLPEALAADADRRGRFEREARAVAALNHPNIVTIHSVEEADGVHFLTMELVDGERLTRRIGEQGLELDRFFDIAIPLADAVHAAHQQGIMHRDLKPDNVMVNKDGRVKVLDFGLAKLRETPGLAGDDAAATATVTAEGRIVGTVSYMSPEQAEGKPVDERSDIFSLGIVLYEMATGRRPFSGDTPLSTMSAILKDAPVSVTELKHRLPRHLGRVIATCLEKAPERRYQSALDVRNELERLREEVESGDIEVSRVSYEPLPERRKVPRAAAIVAGALVVVATLVWAVFLRGGGEPGKPPAATQRTVGVIGFENLSDPSDAGNLGRMLMSLVTTDMTESGGLGVVSTAKVLAAYRQSGGSDRVAFDAAVASETARLAGADIMLVGQILTRGETMMLTAELVDVASGKALASVSHEAGSSDELFALAGSIAGSVRESLGVQSAVEEFDLAGTLTDSAEAYRQYVAGNLALHASHYGEAIGHYEAAIRLDPTFAWAYYRLGLAQSWLGTPTTGYERGNAHVERLPERWQIVFRATLDYERGDPDGAVASLERLLRDAPDIPDAYNMLGELQTHFSRHENSVAAMKNFETALEIDPTFRVVFFHLLDFYVLSGNEAAIERLIRKIQELDPGHVQIDLAEIARLYLRGERAELVRFFDTLEDVGGVSHHYYADSLGRLGEWDRFDRWNAKQIEQNAQFMRAVYVGSRGWGAFQRGRFDAAVRDALEAADIFLLEFDFPSLGGEARRFAGASLELLGRTDAAIDMYRTSIEADPFLGAAFFSLIDVLAREGRLEESRELLETLERSLSPDPDAVNHCWSHLARASMLLAGGDAPGTREAVSRLRPESCWFHDEYSGWLRAESHELDGEYAAAVAAWRDVIEPARPRYPGRLSIEVPAWHRLGAALEKTGDVREARAAYRRVVDAWGDGDDGIPAVEESRQRLAALGG